MPTYHIGCNDCFKDFEEVQPMRVGPPEVCKFCDSTNVEQIYYPPPILTKSEPKTLGHLGDRNRDAMSQMEFTDKTEQQEARSVLGRKQMGIKEKQKANKPWWRTTDKVDTRLAQMSESDTAHYIKTGSKPFKDAEGE